ncbi:ABC transporter ATP-binding protein [Pigmentiphaga soli]
MDNATDARIEVAGLTKRYLRRGGGKPVVPVNDTSFTVGSAEMVVLLGPSGCGKTTLLRCIAGLERPDEGEISINGQVVFSSRRGIFVPPNRRPISMVFQTYALWPHMTVFDNVAYPLRCRGADRGRIEASVMEALSMVGLAALARQYPGQISGGQQQRVALARAVVPRTGVVLFDEPLSNVDAKVREQLRAEISRMQRALGFSGLYVTHDQVEAMAIADRVALIDDGRIEQIGAPEEIYHHPVSPYVGSFIGSANLWPGRVAACDRERVTVRTSFGDVQVGVPAVLPAGWPQVAPDAPVTVMARPEVIAIGREAPSAVNGFAGVIESKAFLGANVEFTLLVGKERIRAAVPRSDIAASEESAWIGIDPKNLVLLSDGRAAAGQ